MPNLLKKSLKLPVQKCIYSGFEWNRSQLFNALGKTHFKQRYSLVVGPLRGVGGTPWTTKENGF